MRSPNFWATYIYLLKSGSLVTLGTRWPLSPKMTHLSRDTKRALETDVKTKRTYVSEPAALRVHPIRAPR